MNYRVWGIPPGCVNSISLEIEADTAADAAIKWAEEADSRPYVSPISDGPAIQIYVRTFGDTQPRRFTVTAEQHYTYRAQIAAATKEPA